MNKSKIRNYIIFSILFIFILGTILHFTYQWSDRNPFVGIFSAVNESTWEHLKLIFFPMLITTIIGYFYLGKDLNNFICAKTIGILSAMLFIVIFFYTYTGILGTNISIIDISLFYIATIVGEIISYRLISNNFKYNNKLAIITLILLLICFILFTFYPPNIGLFKDPITSMYGII